MKEKVASFRFRAIPVPAVSRLADRCRLCYLAILVVALNSLAAGQLISQNCRISWVLTLNSYTAGGVLDVSATTTDQCLNRCLTDLSCRGVQVHHLVSDTVECWRFYFDNFALSSSLVFGYDQYTLQTRCYGAACSTKWQYWENTKFQASGNYFSGVTNVPSCLATCIQTQGCIGVDVKKTAFPLQCFIHFNSSAAGNVLFTQEYDQYLLLDACATSSTALPSPTTTRALSYCWNETVRSQYVGLDQVSLNTIPDCKAWCIGLPKCSVINFDPTTVPPCWVQTDGSPYDVTNIYTNPVVTSFYLDRNCASSISASSTALTSSTTTRALSYCWNETVRSQYVGLDQVSLNTIPDCKAWCIGLPKCSVINFDPTTVPPCWVQTDGSPYDVTNIYTNPVVTSFYLDRNCASSTSTSSSTATSRTNRPRTGCWSTVPFTKNSFLTQSNYYTVVSCQQYCQSIPACSLMNFNVNTLPPCWVQTYFGSFPSSTDQYVNSYILDRTCLSGSSSSSSSLSSSSSSTTSTASTSCVEWTEILLSGSEDGVLQPYKTLDSCKNGCVSLPTCLAIDYDFVFQQCFNHYNSDYQSKPIATQTANQYRLQRDTGCYTSTGQSTQAPTDCFSWTSIIGSNSINGVQQPMYPFVDLCKQGCIADSRCVAIDFDFASNPPCWFHFDASDLLQLYDYPTNVQYRLLRNPLCQTTCFTWSEKKYSISVNGVLQPTYKTLDDCKNACTKTPACLAIDYDTSGSENCWFHTNPDDLKDHYDSDTASQYILARDPTCSTTSSTASTTSSVQASRPCVSNILNNTSSIGGSNVPNVNSASGCWSYCLSSPSCVGVDFDPQYGCYEHNNVASFVSNRQFNQSPGVTQYVISRNCGLTGVSTQTSTRPSGPSSCVVQVYQSTNSIGGAAVLGITSSQECVNFCLSLVTCVGVDFDSQSTCWQHNNRTAFDVQRKLGQSPGVTQYVVSHNCQSIDSTSTSTTTTTTLRPVNPDCAGSFQVFFNTSSPGGSNQEKITTSIDCLFFCLENPNACAALDFDSKSGCWLHLDRFQVLAFRSYPSPGVTQFVMEKSCYVSLPVCAFQVFKNTYTVNGLFLSEVRGLSACLYYCLITPSCVAVDYSDTGTCVVHSDIYYVELSRRRAIGYTQFILNRVSCAVVPPLETLNPRISTTSTASTSSSTSMSTTTTTPYVPLGCPPTWTRHASTYSFGGNLQTQYTSLDACLAGCARDPTCYAVDVETSISFKCFFHANPVSDADAYSGLPTQYRIYRPCIGSGSIPGQCQNWENNPGFNSINGVHYFQFQTETSCKLLCVNIPSCVAVDFDTRSSSDSFGCWVHKSPQDLLLENTFLSPGVNQFKLNRVCQGICSYSWVPYPSSSMMSGISQRDTTLDGCQARCISIPECTGIDVDKRPGYAYCYLMLSTNLYLFPNPNVDHYQLARSPDCPESKTSTTTQSSTTTSSLISPGCSVKMMQSMNSDGGDRQTQPMSKEACISLCISLYPQCVAADWRISDSNCFLHNSLSNSRTSSCCVRYEIVCSQSEGLTGCVDDFLAQKYTVLILESMLIQPSITLLGQCQAACINYGQSCLGVVFSAFGRVIQGQSTCYFVTSLSSLNTATPSYDFDLYVRRFCQRDLSGFLSTTPYPTPSPGSCILDVVFLVDTSGSILDNQPPGIISMQLIRSFLSSFLTSYVGYYFDHIGLVTFDTTARIAYDLCNLQTVPAINSSGISKVVQSLGTTNTPAGFDAVYEMLFNPSRCARSTARPVVVLITDGHTSAEFLPFYQNSLNKLVNTGVLRIAIGITTDVNNYELQQFASPSATSGIFLLDNYYQLSNYQSRIYNLMASQCGRGQRANPILPQDFDSSTSTTTTTTTTTYLLPTTTTTQYIARDGRRYAFGVYLSSSLQGPARPIRYDQAWASNDYGYQTQVSGFYSPEGLFFFDLGAGIEPGRRVALSLNVDDREIAVFNWQSTAFNGLVTESRFVVLYLRYGQFVSVTLSSDSYLSSDDKSRYSSFSGFSIAGVLSSDSNRFSMIAEPLLPQYPFQGINTTLQLTSTVPSLTGNIAGGTSYTCPFTGNYLFTMSMGVWGNQKTRLALVGLNPRVEISSMSTSARNGVMSLSRAVLLFCSQGATVNFVLVSGYIADRNSTSFSAHYLENTGQGLNHAWALYKSYNSDTRNGSPLDPFYFNVVGVNPYSLYNTNKLLVRIVLPGHYYLQVSAGVQTASPLNMRLVLTRGGSPSTLLYLTGQATNTDGEEFLSHGLVYRLESGDELKVVADVPSFIYNSELGHQTSFIGFFLYP